MFVKTAGRPGRRGFNESRSSWPQALSSLVLISVAGFQPAANCSLISQSQEALATLRSQLQGSRPVPSSRRGRDGAGPLPSQQNLALLTWTLLTPWAQCGTGEPVGWSCSQVRGPGVRLAPTCCPTLTLLRRIHFLSEAKSNKMGVTESPNASSSSKRFLLF